jgi:hypothetical protein
MHFFGLYPWECVDCQEHFFSIQRYSRSKRNALGEIYTGNKPAPGVKPGSEEVRPQ